MLVNPTMEKLHELRLGGMATALAEQLERPDRYTELDFTARLGLLVDRELTEHDNRRLARHLKTAKLRSDAVRRGHRLPAAPGTGTGPARRPRRGRWVTTTQNPIVGPTGVGKTYVACALATPPSAGHSARSTSSITPFRRAGLAHVDGTDSRCRHAGPRRRARDRRLRTPPADTGRPPSCSRSSRTASQRVTIMTSQLPISNWHEHLADQTLADAIFDRILQAPRRVELCGESLRQPPSEPVHRHHRSHSVTLTPPTRAARAGSQTPVMSLPALSGAPTTNLRGGNPEAEPSLTLQRQPRHRTKTTRTTAPKPSDAVLHYTRIRNRLFEAVDAKGRHPCLTSE